MFSESRLWQRIVAHATADPQRPAYIDRSSGRQLNYSELVQATKTHAADNHRDVLLPCDNTIDFAPRFLGTLLAGRSVLPVRTDLPEKELQRLAGVIAQNESSAREATLLLTTSGSTAVPKTVRRSTASLDAVSEAMVAAIDFTTADRVVAAVPLSHSYGLEHGLLAPLWAGSTVLLCDGLDLPRLTEALSNSATIFPAVPSMIEMLTRVSADLALKTLRRVYTAGAPLPPTVANAFQTHFGIAIGQIYGSTEVGSVVYRDPLLDSADSVGRGMPGVSIRILSTGDLRSILPPGEEGEVAIAAPSMLSDYVGEAVQLIDGHYPTGDIGRLSEHGELTLVGRVRLLIDVGGAKVNPLEVERVLESHPAVAAAVVLPLELSETVRKVRAIVVPTDPTNPPSVAALREHARQHLATYKVPRVIEFRDFLPRTAAGKIARQELATTETP